MSINLTKSSVPSITPLGDPIEALRTKVSSRIFDAYCDMGLRAELIRFGVSDLGLDPSKATIVADMELEALSCANENKLCEELDSLLRRFTDIDKKLDSKERSDSIQMVCRPKPGYTKGLAFDIAEKRVLEFCRANRVKVKVGLLRWDVP